MLLKELAAAVAANQPLQISDGENQRVSLSRTKARTSARTSGILLHPTSLPGRFGIGDLGDEAYAFVDFLAASAQTLWQILPLAPTGYGDSPYQALSAFAGNPLLISPAQLVKDGLLTTKELEPLARARADRVHFGRVINYKKNLLTRAFATFNRTAETPRRAEFLEFVENHHAWLDDWALFRALKDAHHGAAWNTWEAPLARRQPTAIATAHHTLREPIEAEKFAQFLFFRQWLALKAYANQRNIRLIGDMPIFVAYDSADVWTNPQLFKLDDKARPRVVAGVPPDYFSATGQLWGNPLYDWQQRRSDLFNWWTARLRAAFQIVDLLRLDHFRGFSASWEVPFGDSTAERGQWVEMPGRELFTELERRLGELPILAEDLGVITPDVEKLRDDFGFPGMRVLQFAFRSDSANPDLPHNYSRNSVVYTGTHDNDTTVGWFHSQAGTGSTRDAAQIARERDFCLRYLNTRGKAIHWDFIRAALSSVAAMAIIPLQDVLGLGSQARMNLPASPSGNWSWRCKAGVLTESLAARLQELTTFYNRGASGEKD